VAPSGKERAIVWRVEGAGQAADFRVAGGRPSEFSASAPVAGEAPSCEPFDAEFPALEPGAFPDGEPLSDAGERAVGGGEDLMAGHLPQPGGREMGSRPGAPRGIAVRSGSGTGVAWEEGAAGGAAPGAGAAEPWQGPGDRSIARGSGRRTDGRLPSYPRAARERGWEGEVLLDLEIDRGGRVLAARVARSSGHAVLDAAALEVAPGWVFEPDPAGAVTLRVPVLFRLR